MADSEAVPQFERIKVDWVTGSGQAVTCCMELLLILFSSVQIPVVIIFLVFNQYTDKLSCSTHSYEGT